MPGARRRTRIGKKFDDCVRSVRARGEVDDPRAVCAAALNRAHPGALSRASAAARRRPRRNPKRGPQAFRACVNASSGWFGDPAKTCARRYGAAPTEEPKRNPARSAWRNPAALKRCVKDVQAKGTAQNAYAVCTAAMQRKYGKARYRRMVQAEHARARRNHAGVLRRLRETEPGHWHLEQVDPSNAVQAGDTIVAPGYSLSVNAPVSGRSQVSFGRAWFGRYRGGWRRVAKGALGSIKGVYDHDAHALEFRDADVAKLHGPDAHHLEELAQAFLRGVRRA